MPVGGIKSRRDNARPHEAESTAGVRASPDHRAADVADRLWLELVRRWQAAAANIATIVVVSGCRRAEKGKGALLARAARRVLALRLTISIGEAGLAEACGRFANRTGYAATTARPAQTTR